MQLGGTFFGTCSSEGSQTTKVVNDCLGFVLYTGASIYVRFTETNTGALSSLMLNVNNTGAKPIKRYGTTNLNALDAITAGMVCNFVYDGSYWQWVGQMNTDTNIIPSAYCNTITSNPAKVAQCTDFVLRDNSYISIIFAQGNTSAGAFTLNINDTGAKQVYLNGNISGQSNYQFSAGSYILYYDGTAYQMRTDGLIHGVTTGNIINITNNGSTIYYTYGDGTTASFVMPHTQYTAGSAISISNNQITNTGVRAVGQGTENGTISVNTSGVTTNVAVKGLGSAAYENANTFASVSHIHGNISNLGHVTGNDTTISNGDSLLIADASDDDRLVKTTITFDGTTTNQFLTKAGTWAAAQNAVAHAGSAGYAIHAASAGYATTAGNATDNTKVAKTGDTMSGNLILATTANGATPAIIFQRGTFTDNYNDWRIQDSSGLLYFGQRGSESSDFDSAISFNNTGGINATNFNGHASCATYAANANSANHAVHAASATYVMTAQNAVHAGSAGYAASAAQATYAASANYSTSAGFATKAAQDASGNVITTTYATKTELNNLIAGADAMVYKGTLAGGTTTTYTPAANSGDTYRVSTAGLINGIKVEVGDILICCVDNTAVATSTNVDTIKANWDIIQTNIDGAVTTTQISSTSGAAAIFAGTGGQQIIKAVSVGSSTKPIYFDTNGVPQPITSYEGKSGSANYAASAAQATHAASANYAASAAQATHAASAAYATTAEKVGSTTIGDILEPIYVNSGTLTSSSGKTIPFIKGPTTDTTAGTWTGTLTGLTAYYDGLLILYKPAIAGASTTTLNINSLGAKTCYLNNTSKLTTHYPANQPILLAYSTSQNSECWMAIDNYDSNSDTKVRQSLKTDNVNRPLLMAYSDNTVTTANVDNVSYRANAIYANASTGRITATEFAGKLVGTANNAITASNAASAMTATASITAAAALTAKHSTGTVITGITFGAGSTPSLGTAIPADDITAWTPNQIPTATVNNGVLIFYAGTTASLSYTAKSIPNVTGVGSVPTLSYTTATYVKSIG